MTPITPGIVLSNGETYYPTGVEWLLAFALKGCKWAEDMLQTPEMEEARRLWHLRSTDPIVTMWGTF